MIRRYSELIRLKSFEERFEYLKLGGEVGKSTFGFDRYLNQAFYRSKEWKELRNHIIVRDHGCDLGVDGYDIYGKIYIHHMNPITINDLLNNKEYVFNEEYLISSTFDTHNAIHYGNFDLIDASLVKRRPNDTCLWRNAK